MKSFNDYYNIHSVNQKPRNITIVNPHKASKKPSIVNRYISEFAKSNTELIVVIPVYKNKLTDFEFRNLKNTINRIGETYPIMLLCPQSLDIDIYKGWFCYNFSYIKYPDLNFKSKNSYSYMLENPSLYKQLSLWTYSMFIQADVWIFGDVSQMSEFLKYNYVGGPWNKEYIKKVFGIDNEFCGNGGMTVRKNSVMVDILSDSEAKKSVSKYITVEDLFISYILYNKKLNNCPVSVANKFSIDNYPEYWHNKLKKQNIQLPFAVHMGKQEFIEYWDDYIEKNIIKIYGNSVFLTRKESIIVSFTSFGKRLKLDAPRVIKDFIQKQTMLPDLIVLTIYKDDVENIPEYFKELQKKNIMEIIIADNNYRPHLKYFYVMKKYPESIIVTIDDDQLYNKDLINNLYNCYLEYPDCVVANRCHKIRYDKNGNAVEYSNWEWESKSTDKPSFDLFATGVGGVLYPPNILKLDKNDESRITDYITTDDIFLKVIENKKNIKVIGLGNKSNRLYSIPMNNQRNNRLCDVNTKKNGINDINIKKSQELNSKTPIKPNNIMKVIYTCISGKYDTLKEPKTVTPGWKYICFTDLQDFKSNVWEIRPIPDSIMSDSSLSQVKKQRIMKIQSYLFFDYDVCIWCDGNLEIIGDLDELLAIYKDSDCAISTHPVRRCIYREGDILVRVKKDTKQSIDTQCTFYKKEGFPQNFGLHETNVIIRKNTPEINEIMDMWAELLRKYSHRDLMSFNYVLWKLDKKDLVSDLKPVRYKFFKLSRHILNKKY